MGVGLTCHKEHLMGMCSEDNESICSLRSHGAVVGNTTGIEVDLLSGIDEEHRELPSVNSDYWPIELSTVSPLFQARGILSPT